MDYKGVYDLIKTVAESVNINGTFFFGRREDNSKKSTGNDTRFPMINLLPFRESTDRKTANNEWNVTVMFWLESTAGDDPETLLEVNQAAYVLKEAFMNKLYDNKGLSIKSEIATPEYKQLAGTVSGFGVNFIILSKVECYD